MHMTAYYLQLAWQNLRRSPWLTALTVLAVAVGIGSSMTVYSLLRAMARDPIPHRSAQLFVPQIDNGLNHPAGGSAIPPGSSTVDEQPAIPAMLTWRDAMALRDAKLGSRQAAMTEFQSSVADESGENSQALVNTLATDADFFAMFDVPMQDGAHWGGAEDSSEARVAVLGPSLAARLFPGAEPVGKRLRMGSHIYRVIGVTGRWSPKPRVHMAPVQASARLARLDRGTYPVINTFGVDSELFVPFSAWVTHYRSGPDLEGRIPPAPGSVSCPADVSLRVREDFLRNECAWVRLWIELTGSRDVERARQFLQGYAVEQQRLGRFDWLPATHLASAREWISERRFVPGEYRIAPLVGFGFLLVCLVNAMCLMFARCHHRIEEMKLRRAMGASRARLVAQGMVEAALVGVAGGLAGVGLLALGAYIQRGVLAPSLKQLASVDAGVALLAIGIAVAGTVLAGLYPVWQATRRKGGGAGQGKTRATAWLISVQVSLTLAIASSALFIAWQRIADMRKPTGVDSENLFMAISQWPASPDDMAARAQRDLAALRAIPGVVDAAQIFGIPGAAGSGGGQIGLFVEPPSHAAQPPDIIASVTFADDHAVSTLGLNIVGGRNFRPDEVSPVGPVAQRAPNTLAVISRPMAERLFPGEYALGKPLYLVRPYGFQVVTYTIVGLAESMQGMAIDDNMEYSVMVSHFRDQENIVPYVIRSQAGQIDRVMRDAETTLRRLDSTRAFLPFDIKNPGSIFVRHTELRRFITFGSHRLVTATLIGVCVLLLLTVALGIVGTTSYSISRRRHQIGVRRALGATRSGILRSFMAENLLVVGAGVLAGTVLAVAGNLWLASRFEMSRIDPLAVLAGAALIVLLSQLAAFWPALRASLVPPAVATRAG